MEAPTTAATAKAGRTIAGEKILNRRGRYLISPAYQLRIVFSVGGLAALLIAALDVTYYRLQQAQSARTIQLVPELQQMIRGQDQLEMMLVLFGSVVGLLGVISIALIETQRTAGPLYKLGRTMERLGAEGPIVRLRFRRDDRFHELEESFNAMANALDARCKLRAAQALSLLGSLRETADSLARPAVDLDAAKGQIRTLVAEMERLQGDLEVF